MRNGLILRDLYRTLGDRQFESSPGQGLINLVKFSCKSQKYPWPKIEGCPRIEGLLYFQGFTNLLKPC